MNISEEATVEAEYFDDDLVDLEALLGDDAFMSTEAWLSCIYCIILIPTKFKRLVWQYILGYNWDPSVNFKYMD